MVCASDRPPGLDWRTTVTGETCAPRPPESVVSLRGNVATAILNGVGATHGRDHGVRTAGAVAEEAAEMLNSGSACSSTCRGSVGADVSSMARAHRSWPRRASRWTRRWRW